VLDEMAGWAKRNHARVGARLDWPASATIADDGGRR
jgi:hypothetical protein